MLATPLIPGSSGKERDFWDGISRSRVDGENLGTCWK